MDNLSLHKIRTMYDLDNLSLHKIKTDAYKKIIIACCVSFIEDYFYYLSIDDIPMAKSVLYQFNHCPWLEEITDRPKEIIEYMIMEGRRRYGKKANLN